MPRSNGVYSLPPGYLATTGQTILASQHNPPLEDIATALTGSLPRDGSAPMQANLPMGGFKATGASNGTANDDLATYGQLLSMFPLGVPLDYLGTTAPAGWIFCYGQAISRTTYAALFAVLGTTYGTGDGSTTFNIPDFRGRVSAGKDDMGGTAANRLATQVSGATLGAAGGFETHILTVPQMPAHEHQGQTSLNGSHFHLQGYSAFTGNTSRYGETVTAETTIFDGSTSSSSNRALNTSSAPDHSHSFTTSTVGGGTAHNNVQPTLILNKIIRTGV